MAQVHMIDKDGKTICGRDRFFGAKRTKELFMVDGKTFIATFKRDSSSCCANCVAEYNRRVKQ